MALEYNAAVCRQLVQALETTSGCTAETCMEPGMATCHMDSLRRVHHRAKSKEQRQEARSDPESVEHTCPGHRGNS